MTIKELLTTTAALVEGRETIDHGTIRCLYSQEDVRCIESAEGCDEVETGTIGDDDLAEKLRNLTEDPELMLSATADDFADALAELYKSHLGDNISNYLQRDKEDELSDLDDLISAAQKFVDTL